jgi:PAS domain S-box-containing protein
MTRLKAPVRAVGIEEISALIEVLHETEQRLEELTGGEVDSVSDQAGRTFLLRRAQDKLRYTEAAKQEAILNALPAHIAMLDAQGIIMSANTSWQKFALTTTVLLSPGYGIGVNYLDICDRANGDSAADAHQAAQGIRSVLAGGAKSFSIEYVCHSAEEQRWFLLTVTPLAEGPPNGAVVMHLNITAQKQAKNELRESERRFRDMLGNIELVSIMIDREGRIIYCNDYFLGLTGWQREQVLGQSFFELFIPPDLADELQDVRSALLADLPEAGHHENAILTRSGERRLIRWNNSVLRSGAGDVIGTASIGEDVTERKIVDEVLQKRAAELERFHRLSVGRELQMIELKKQVNELATRAGQKPPYDLAFLGEQAVKTNPADEQTASVREDFAR